MIFLEDDKRVFQVFIDRLAKTFELETQHPDEGVEIAVGDNFVQLRMDGGTKYFLSMLTLLYFISLLFTINDKNH